MGQKDSRVDAYITRSPEFARPILSHLRKVVHAGCPDVVETLKWSSPSFEHKGILCGMAAFKNHCAFGFWKHSLVVPESSEEAMGQFGRITAVSDLPAERILLGYVRKAAALNERGVRLPAKPRPKTRTDLEVPEYFIKALRGNRKARATFDAFSYSNRKEYVEWVAEAKQEATRNRRLATAIEWMAEGKVRNWKYVR